MATISGSRSRKLCTCTEGALQCQTLTPSVTVTSYLMESSTSTVIPVLAVTDTRTGEALTAGEIIGIVMATAAVLVVVIAFVGVILFVVIRNYNHSKMMVAQR